MTYMVLSTIPFVTAEGEYHIAQILDLHPEMTLKEVALFLRANQPEHR
jgi:hypothetical protein